MDSKQVVVKETGPTQVEVPIAHEERTQTEYVVAGTSPDKAAGEAAELWVGVDAPVGAVVEVLTNNWYPLAGAEAGAVQEIEAVEEPTLFATTAGEVGAEQGGGLATRTLSMYKLLPYSEIPLNETLLVLAGRFTVFSPH